jgi:hypothetical protein
MLILARATRAIQTTTEQNYIKFKTLSFWYETYEV